MSIANNMNTGVRLLSIMRRIVREPKKSSDYTDVVYGSVISVAPLTVQIDNKNTISGDMIVVGALCKETIIQIPFPEKGEVRHKHQAIHDGYHNTTMEMPKIQLWRGLNVGDTVLMIRFAQGQKYYLMQRKEGIP